MIRIKRSRRHVSAYPTACTLCKACVLMLGLVVGHSSAAFADTSADAIKSAWQSLQQGEYDQAIADYEKARELLPKNAEIPYNLGVAHYRKGDFAKAAELFESAITLASDPSLRSRSIYNMGNAAYAQSLKALQEQGDASQPNAQLNQAASLLKNAFDSYKKAVDANPRDNDAKANAELSHRLLKQLEEMQQQQQQQQSSDQQNQEQQEQQDENQQQQQSQQQSEQQQSDQSSKSEASEQQSDQQSQQQQQPDSPEPQEHQASDANQPEQEQPAQAQATPQQEDEQSEPPPDQGERAQQPPPDKKSMTRDEAERLLQAVRDKERQRRAELARREAIKHAPVDKDW